MLRKLTAAAFAFFLLAALFQCGRRGSPSGGPKDETPPVLLRAEPANGTTGFQSTRIRLYFDEYVRLQDVQNQLIISPPMKTPPLITPMGGASKVIQIDIKDTLRENTTYTFNFGQSVVDHNEGNPYPLLTYVFSTGEYLDSLSLIGAVADGFKRSPDPFISVMLYEIDSAYTDSTIYQEPPYYLTNTLDSAVIFQLNNLKAGRYRLVAIQDEGKDNTFTPNADKIGFVADTITLPTDSTYVLRLFREIPDYGIRKPSFVASNHIVFGFTGGRAPLLERITPLPDSVRTHVARERGKDSLNLWITPFEADSLLFVLQDPLREGRRDTVTVKPISSQPDTLRLSWVPGRNLVPVDSVYLESTLPLAAVDTSRFRMVDQDTLPVPFALRADSLGRRVYLDFEKQANRTYSLELYPGAVTDFFGGTNDSLSNRWSIGSPADYGTLRMTLQGAVTYPVVAELTDDRDRLVRTEKLSSPKELVFRWLEPGTYRFRLILDANGNGRWDTGSFLEKRQPEQVVYFPAPIEMRANWEDRRTFTIQE
ncbi:Ig-like domain-containing protein [Robiginitalea sp. M366]|uniref:Ig-like domain-containing protein n=1 Tax=Robiginitalea aestuariiviva TaxID=3036903 RepID=UPI00240D605A|nr:Ig-like domain-containing protein [Robiginitalea aestuariiviva]MDG1571680.1 Ig-like domain-containing protein [Robiginitalea aestuariiviva]